MFQSAQLFFLRDLVQRELLDLSEKRGLHFAEAYACVVITPLFSCIFVALSASDTGITVSPT